MRPRIDRPRAAFVSVLAVTSLALLTTACGSGPTATSAGRSTAAPPSSASRPAPSSASPRTIASTYAPTINPADFSTKIDNPYFALVPGTRMIYEGTTPDGQQHNVVEVTNQTRTIMGVTTIVVHDVVSVNGKPQEETLDYYAQDKEGNVWYFGEDTKNLSGPTTDTKGSFISGVDGALPGIIMLAHPRVGDTYRQEYYRGHAEDTAEVLSLTGTETVQFGGKRTDLLVTKDVNPLDPAAAIENKYFARGVGFIAIVHVTGPAERVELIGVEKF